MDDPSIRQDASLHERVARASLKRQSAKNRPASAAIQRGHNSSSRNRGLSSSMTHNRPRPKSAIGVSRSSSNRNSRSHMVVLDGYPIPDIDPDHFTNFWRDRLASKKEEESRKRAIAQPRPISASFASGNTVYSSVLSNVSKGSSAADSGELHYPTAGRGGGYGKNRKKRPSTAPGGGKRRIRPGSATANLMARMAMAGPDADAYRTNLEKKNRPISSRDHIRRRAAMRRKAAQEFAEKMVEEEKMIQQDTISRVQEANKYAKVLKMDKKYKHFFDKEQSLQIQVIEDHGKEVSIFSTAIFHREHAKLQKHAVAAGLFGDRIVKGSKSEKAENKEKEANAIMTNSGRRPQRSRAQVLLELKQILADTESLTGVLEGQLNEIEQRGWNKGYV